MASSASDFPNQSHPLDTYGRFGPSGTTVNGSVFETTMHPTGSSVEEWIRVTTPLEVASVCVSVLAIFVNLCVLVVICIGPRAFRTPTFFFISSLATADLVTGATVILAIFLPVSDRSWERIVLKGLAVVSFSASVNNLLVIAADRYLKIRDENSYNKVFTNWTSGLLIVMTWSFAIGIFLVAPLLGWSCAGDKCACAPDGMCQCESDTCSQSLTPFTNSYMIFGVVYFYLSLLAMLALYLGIFLVVRRRSGGKRTNQGSVLGRVSSRGPFVMIHRRREIRLAKTLMIVMGVFFICWLPVTTLFLYDILTDNQHVIEWFDYCLASAVIHPLVNPIIYSMRLPRMWITFKHLGYALWRRTTGKTTAYHGSRSSRFSRSSITRSNTAATTPVQSLRQSFRFKTKAEKSDAATRSSVSTQISVMSQVRQQQSNDSSEEMEAFVNEDVRTGTNLSRSLSTRTSSSAVVLRNNNVKRDPKKSYSCRNSPRFVVNYRRSQSSKSLRRNNSIVLANGSVVSRENVTISTPFNAESKLSWT